MKIVLVGFFLILSLNLYSYSLGLGFVGGGAATDIEALESTSTCETCVGNFEYKYKLGVSLVNKFQISETIFIKFNLAFISLNIDFKDTKLDNPFLIKTDLALEFYPIKEFFSGFYFGGGLFINYFITDKFSEANHGFAMLSAFVNTGYKIPFSKNLSLFVDFSVELLDVISIESKTKAYLGLSSNIYFLYTF